MTVTKNKKKERIIAVPEHAVPDFESVNLNMI